MAQLSIQFSKRFLHQVSYDNLSFLQYFKEILGLIKSFLSEKLTDDLRIKFFQFLIQFLRLLILDLCGLQTDYDLKKFQGSIICFEVLKV